MKILGSVGAAFLFAVLVISPLAAQDEHPAQNEHHQAAPAEHQAKPASEPHKAPSAESRRSTVHQDSRPAERQSAQHENHTQPPPNSQPKQAQKDERTPQTNQAHRAQNESHAGNRNPNLRAQNSRPEYANSGHGGQRIPEDRFHAHFGRDHHFRIGHPTFVAGRPRFQYSGYWFQLLSPWPAVWSYDDDCYIDYLDGEYWLFDPMHPGMRIEVEIAP